MTYLTQPPAFAVAAPLHPSLQRYHTLSPTSLLVPRTWCVPQSRVPCMSLINELVIKGLEEGVATALGRAVAPQASKPRRKGRRVHTRGPRSRERDPAPSASSVDAAAIVTELCRLADQLPVLLKKGGPQGKKWVKLAICLAIDLVGSGTLGLPFLGDALDLVTAPLSAVMLQALFGNSLVTILGFSEEILPGTDAIPTATLAWLAEEYGYLQVGKDRDREAG